MDRRQFLKNSLKVGIGITTGISLVNSSKADQLHVLTNTKKKPLDIVRIGLIGVGGMGTNHLKIFYSLDRCEVVAVSDIIESRVRRAQLLAKKAKIKEPDGYFSSPYDFKLICERNDIDLIFVATPWKWHVPMALYGMQCEKHVAVEVPAAMYIEDCWKLIETSESTGQYCIMMENCNYDYFEMTILNMIKQGLFGELLHAECGYLHDLRYSKFNINGEGKWRRKWSRERNGDLYPTHGLGPIAQFMDINRGNYFDYLVSVGTKSRGLHLYALEHFGIDSSEAKEKFKLSDIVTTIIKTKREETIVLTHNTNNPRPYSRNVLVQGTKGITRKYPVPKIYIEGKSLLHQWESFQKYESEYMHPLWKNLRHNGKAVKPIHGGMDYLEDYRLINALLSGSEPDMDVYDAAVLSSVIHLSQQSLQNSSNPVPFPDFTKGGWKVKRQLRVMDKVIY